MLERGHAGHAADARGDDGALGDLHLADAPPALELHHARAAGDGERAHEKVEAVVLEQADDAAVVAVLAHGDREARQRQDVANERRPRDELVGAGAQRLFAPPAIADGDDGQLARHRLLAQAADQRQRLGAVDGDHEQLRHARLRHGERVFAVARGVDLVPCPLEAEAECRAALAGGVENDQRLEVRHARQSIY